MERLPPSLGGNPRDGVYHNYYHSISSTRFQAPPPPPSKEPFTGSSLTVHKKNPITKYIRSTEKAKFLVECASLNLK